MELVEVISDEQIADRELRDSHLNGSRTAVTRHFVALEGTAEVGFLAVDISPEAEYLVFYTLFVPPALRRRGIASRILAAGEKLGTRLGYHKALLRARTLDESFTQVDIESWYHRLGYSVLDNSQGALVKTL